MLGLAFGYSSVKTDHLGKQYLDRAGKGWPWADTPDHYEALFQEAQENLMDSAERMGANCVINADMRLFHDTENPEMVIWGTAVVLKDAVPADGKPSSPRTGPMEVEWDWGPISIDKRGPGKEEPVPEDPVGNLANRLDVSSEKARLLIGSGLCTVERIAVSEIKDISAIDGINPTQARIIKGKAVELIKGG